MGTKNVTTQSAAFAPAAMQAYNALMPQMQGVLSNMMQNPMQAGYLNMLLQQGNKGAAQQGVVQQQNLMQNMAAGGFGGQNMNAFLQSQLGKIGRGVSGMKAQNYMNTLLMAPQLQMQAAGMAQNFRPLQTGQTTTQQQSGLGTWLPTVLGAGLNFATGGGLGMLGGLFGGQHPQMTLPNMNSLNMGPGFGSIGQLPGAGQMPTSGPMSYGGMWQSPIGGLTPGYGGAMPPMGVI